MAADRRQYRMEELAEEAGISVRTLRFYRERKLIGQPRREGRIAWYDDSHLARLRTITALLERGHTLNGIAELADAFDGGRGVADLLGQGFAPTEETPLRLTPEDLAERFGDQVTPDDLAAAVKLGYVNPSGSEIVHVSSRLLDASAELVRFGIPLSQVLRAAGEVRSHTEAMVSLFSDMMLEQASLEELQALRPMAKGIVEAELSLAMDRRFAEEFTKRMGDPGPAAEADATNEADATDSTDETRSTDATDSTDVDAAAGEAGDVRDAPDRAAANGTG